MEPKSCIGVVNRETEDEPTATIILTAFYHAGDYFGGNLRNSCSVMVLSFAE